MGSMAYLKIIAAIMAGETFIKQYIADKEKEGKKEWKLPGGIVIRRLENGGAATGILSNHKKRTENMQRGHSVGRWPFAVKRKKKTTGFRGGSRIGSDTGRRSL